MKEVLKVNKTKFCKLLQTYGYHPSVRRSSLIKYPMSYSWQLAWNEPGKSYEAYITSTLGRVFLKVTEVNAESQKIHTPTLETIRSFGMTEVIEK